MRIKMYDCGCTIHHSDEINEVLFSIALAKSKMEPLIKDKLSGVGGKKSKYADLEAVLKVVIPQLEPHGLGLTTPQISVNGKWFIQAIVSHKDSKQYVKSCVELLVDSKQISSMRDLGSAITYARRYGILGIFNLYGDIPDEDDDGASAGKIKSPERNSNPLATSVWKDFQRLDSVNQEIIKESLIKKHGTSMFYKLSDDTLRALGEHIQKKILGDG